MKIFFSKAGFEKFAHKKITFWFNLPRKMCKFWRLRAILQRMILEKNVFLKGMILNVKFFLKSMILNGNVFVKSMILN